MTTEQTLSSTQRAIAPIAAATAAGDMPPLVATLNAGLDAGLSVGDAKEVLVQLYADTCFPRSLNALDNLDWPSRELGHGGRARRPCGR